MIAIISFLKSLFSNGISATVFFGLSILLLIDLLLYFKVFKKLNTLNWEIREGNYEVEPIKSILEEFHGMSINSLDKMNGHSFVESYFSSYQINLFGEDGDDLEEKWMISVVNALNFVQKSVSLFILVGVLGTFIGLYYSLNHLPTANINPGEFGMVMAGMRIAFNTSIVGMLYSLIVNFIIKIFNAEQLLVEIMLKLENHLDNRLYSENLKKNLFTEAVNKLQQTMMNTYTTSINDLKAVMDDIYASMSGLQNFADEFKEGKKYLSQFNYRLAKSIEKFEGFYQNLEGIYSNSKDFSQEFKRGIDKFNGNFASLFEYFSKMKENQKELNNTFERRIGVQKENNRALKGLSRDLKGYLNDYQGQLKEQGDFIARVSDGHQNLVESCQEMNRNSTKLVYQLDALVEQFEEDRLDNIKKIDRLIEGVSQKHQQSLNESLKEFKNYIEKSSNLIDTNFKEVDDSVQKITKVVKSLNQDIKQHGNSTKELKEAVKRFVQEDQRVNNELKRLPQRELDDYYNSISDDKSED